MNFKPMLAGKAPDFSHVKYPVIATPKIDGIRCVIWNFRALTRSLKPIPNNYIREQLERYSDLIQYFDGELVVADSFNSTAMGVMSHGGRPDFVYQVFDYISGKHYKDRLEQLKQGMKNAPQFCRYVEETWIKTKEELEKYESVALAMGYEGVMIRDPYGSYKYGRSTTKEGGLLKIKRFEDGEAIVLGVEPLMTNTNPAFEGELGQTKRSKASAGLIATNMMGALVVRDLKTGVEFNIGSGFTEAERLQEWKEGDIVKYKSQPYGRLEKPRQPIYLGRRMKEDMS